MGNRTLGQSDKKNNALEVWHDNQKTVMNLQRLFSRAAQVQVTVIETTKPQRVMTARVPLSVTPDLSDSPLFPGRLLLQHRFASGESFNKFPPQCQPGLKTTEIERAERKKVRVWQIL